LELVGDIPALPPVDPTAANRSKKMAALAQGETLDLTQFGHSLYHTFLNYCRLPAGKGKSPPPVHNGAPKMSQNQLTRLVADLGLLAPNGTCLLMGWHGDQMGETEWACKQFMRACTLIEPFAWCPYNLLLGPNAQLANHQFPANLMRCMGCPAEDWLDVSLTVTGPVSPHILGVIHASYKPLGSSSLTFGTFLQVRQNAVKHCSLDTCLPS
jgi:hypothetical protein